MKQVEHAGGIPLVLPFTRTEDHESLVATLDGLLLTGGEDIHPDIYGGTPEDGYTYYPQRDAFEIALVKQAIATKLPTLGICRGSQVMHVATEGRLIADLHSRTGATVLHRVDVRTPTIHPVTLQPGSHVSASHRSSRVMVTSYHHQGLAVDERAAARWRVTATSDDGAVEAIELIDDAWIVGVLWHPEQPIHSDEISGSSLIHDFVAQAGRSDV